jgi:hypothetical protein
MKTSSHPAIDELHEKLLANGIEVDPVRIASALLGVVRDLDQRDKPTALFDWVEQLAMDVGNISKRKTT